MKGIQFCHEHDICHRDLKLQNNKNKKLILEKFKINIKNIF